MLERIDENLVKETIVYPEEIIPERTEEITISLFGLRKQINRIDVELANMELELTDRLNRQTELVLEKAELEKKITDIEALPIPIK